MINAKKFEELCCKRTELSAEVKVSKQLLEFIESNERKRLAELTFYDLTVWRNYLKEVRAKITVAEEELQKVIDEINQM